MLPRAQRITTDADFKRIRKRGHKWQSSSFIALLYPQKKREIPRLGVIVSTKIGKSTIRKRASRVLRAAFAKSWDLDNCVDVVLIARPHLKHKTSNQVAEEIKFMQQKRAGLR